MVRVKICGITNREDAEASVAAGADALGFIFVPGTPRCLSPEAAQAIIRGLPPFIVPVGVFAGTSLPEVRATVQACGLGAVQLHGDEDAAFAAAVPVRVIRTIRVRDAGSLVGLAGYPAHAFLLDAYAEDRIGGTGRRVSLELLRAAQRLGRVVVSGGLTPENVAEVVAAVRPYAVDCSSGVERAPGLKDHARVRAFVARVRESHAAISA
ncbi:MAG TPA: phosphoribosylanthranilate isomerase [Candidatus Methylomirabilis sp.]|jgi:phosphoribosylanthranilate isomerase|nr:phosphoribosylanthranilate isomerase [Candidatus Methylomirabilis sp.]